jgi:hypothetical protein
VGLVLGKSNTTIRRLQVYPGVIDEDYTGEIKIMTQAPGAFVAVSPKEKIALLVILPNTKKSKVLTHTLWRDGGFSSSDHAYWVQQVTKDGLERTWFLNEKWFGGLLETGADVSVVAAGHWPKSWPCQPSAADLQGEGPLMAPSRVLSRSIGGMKRDTQGFFNPYVWRRDVLERMGAILWSPNSMVSHQMFLQGYNSFRGLGKYQQGRLHPVQPLGNLGRAGLGYQALQHFQ